MSSAIAAAATPSSRFNISRWALEHPALTRYLMVVLMVLGFAAYFQLGQDEDPPFTFRAMVVQAFWPGATAQQMAEQVTDKIEKTLQEVPHADIIRSYTKPGESLTILQLKDSAPPKEVANTWYQVRKRVGDMRNTLPQGVIGPVFNDDFGDVYGSIYALSADGFSDEELRVHRRRRAPAPAARARRRQGRDLRRAAGEALHRDLAQASGTARPGHEPGDRAARCAERRRGRRRAERRHARTCRCASAAQFDSVDELRRFPIRAINPATGVASNLRLSDIAEIRRGTIDPPAVKVRHQGKAVIALGVSMAKGGDIIALGEALRTKTDELKRDLPAGIEMMQVQDQPRAVSRSVGEFVRVLLEAIVVVLA